MQPIRRYHFHPPGLVYIIVTLFIAVGAINSQNNLLFATLGLAIGGLLGSGVVSGAALMGVRLTREPTSHGVAGQPLPIRYTIRNANRLVPVFGLHIEETTAAGPGLGSPRAFVVHIGPGESLHASAVARPNVRGVARSTGVRVWSTFPFGLVKKSVIFPIEQVFEIRPAILPLRRDLLARWSARAASGVGAEPTPGMGEEFFGLREYTAGDSPRRIAWRASARTGALVVRQYSMPSPVRLWVVLRFTPPSETTRADIALQESAIALAAALLRHAGEAGIAAGLAIPLTGVAIPPHPDRRRLDRALTALSRLEVSAPRAPDLHEAYPEQAARAGRGTIAVVVHAGTADRAFGPRHARHLEAARLETWLEDRAETRAAVALLAREHAA